MIISIRKIRKLSAAIFLTLVIFILPSWAWDRVSTDNSLKDLKVVEVNSEVGNVIIEFPDGHVSSLAIGDQVDQSDLKITAIYNSAIELEGPSDDSGRERKVFIPVIPIVVLDDSYYLGK
jgi:hypothetical protein